MSATPVAQLSPERIEWARLCRGVMLGDPRGYIERYFKIEPDRTGSGPLAPMLFVNEPNQEYYYAQVLPMLRAGWLVDVLCEKDRKARWTSFVAAILTAKLCCKPGTHVFWVAMDQDTFETAHRLVDGFYRNMPEGVRPEVRGNEWGIERKVLRFPTPEGGEIVSTFVLRTANNPNLGTSETPTDVVFDEYAKFPETFGKESQSSMRAAMPAGCSFWRGGTVGPNGPDCAMYRELESIRAGEQQTLVLARLWWDNPSNALPERHPKRRPADLLDRNIVTGDPDGGLDAHLEPQVAQQFPLDGVPVAWRLSQRRAWMVQAMQAAGGAGNEDMARIFFAREHREDNQTPWLVAGRQQFSIALLTRQAAIATARENIPVIDDSLHGLRLRCWRGYDPSHVYILGLDLGSGSGGRSDDTSGQLLDATAMLYMGELHGNVTEPYMAVGGAVLTLYRFGKGVLVIETNRFPGIGNHARTTLGYAATWKPPLRQGESVDHYIQRGYGIHVGATHHSQREPSEEEINAAFKRGFNSGAFRVVNPDLLRTMQRWNPDVDRHPPDRFAGARLALLGLDMARSMQPVTGEIRDTAGGRAPGGRPPVEASSGVLGMRSRFT